MKEVIKKHLKELGIGTKTMFKEFFNKKTNKKQRANMWTFSRLIISIPILVLSILSIINFSPLLLITNSVLTGIGAITDYFDGKSARKHGSTSEFGKKLDQVVDKVFSIIIGATLAIINPIYILPLLGEGIIMMSTLPFSFKYKEAKDTSLYIGKIKQWPLGISFIFGYISMLNLPLSIISNILVSATVLLQLVTAATYTKRNIETVKEIKSKQTSKLLESEENYDKVNTLQKTIGEKDITTKNTNLSRKELCDELRKLRNELIPPNELTNEEKNNQKIKK